MHIPLVLHVGTETYIEDSLFFSGDGGKFLGGGEGLFKLKLADGEKRDDHEILD